MNFYSKFPTNQDVEQFHNQSKNLKKDTSANNAYMAVAYNAHLSNTERLRQVMQDITIEYPNLDCETLKEIASIEEPIKGCHEDYSEFYDDELRIYRLFNIMQVIYDNPKYNQEFEKALKDIKKSYTSFLTNFSYANPEEQKVTTIMKLIKYFTNDSEILLPE